MRFVQIRDRSEATTAEPIDVSGLYGCWLNSNPDTTGIAKMEISEAGGNLVLRAYAMGPEGLIDWGTAAVNTFAATPSSRMCAGFTAVYDFGFAEARLQAMILKGLIVLAEIHRFKDLSRRADYFVREYFALDHARY